jgi:predicted O-methyltransferase YrrM
MSYRRLVHSLMSGKPYFGFALRARQGLFDRHRYFLPLIKAAHAKRSSPLRILEVGSWAGASAVSWAKGLEKACIDGSVLCVDSWAPYFDIRRDSQSVYAEMNAAAATGDILKLFQHNIKACGVDKCVEYRCAEAREILPTLPSGSFDIIFLDGGHTYEQVRFDIQESARLIADGGVISGDDLELQRDALMIDEHLRAVASARDYVWSQSNECSYHPGVTEAVAEFFGPVATWTGFWAVRREGTTWTRVQLSLEGSEIPQHLVEELKADQQDELPPQYPTVELIEETEQYNIVRAGDQFLAVAKSLGPVNLFRERLGERPLGGMIFVGASLDEVRTKALQDGALQDGS